MFRLAFLWLAAISLANPLYAQIIDEDREIAAARQAVFDAPFDEQVHYSERLLVLIAQKFGEESDTYAEELQNYAGLLFSKNEPVEALRISSRAVDILTRLHGADSIQVAYANETYADILAQNGFAKEALEPYGKFVSTFTEFVYACSNGENTVVQNCDQYPVSLPDALLRYAFLHQRAGATENGIRVFEDALARIKPGPERCARHNWNFICSDGPEKRRQIQFRYSIFLDEAGRTEEALILHQQIVIPQLEALKGCPQTSCSYDFRLMGHYENYTNFLLENDRAEMVFELGTRWLPMLVTMPLYQQQKQSPSEESVFAYAARVDKALYDYAVTAEDLGKLDDARQTLAFMNLPQVQDGTSPAQDYEAQIESLRIQIANQSPSDNDYFEKRFELFVELAELNEKIHGRLSSQYITSLHNAGFILKTIGAFERAEMYLRTAFDTSIEGNGFDDFYTNSSAIYLLEVLLAQHRYDEAIALLTQLLGDPSNDKMVLFADESSQGIFTRGLKDPHATLNDFHSLHAELLLLRHPDGANSQHPDAKSDIETALYSARHSAFGKRAYRRAHGNSYFESQSYEHQLWSDEQSLRTFHIPSLVLPYENNEELRRRIYANAFEWGADYSERFLMFVDALAATGKTANLVNRDAFLALQEITMRSTSRAVARSVADKLAGTSGALELVEELGEIDAQLANLGANGQDSEVNEEDDSRERSTDTAARLRFRYLEVSQEIAELVPGYFELLRPEALEVEEAQALLSRDEAVVMAVPSPRGTHMLLLTSNLVRWFQSSLKEDDLHNHLRRLLWDMGADIDVDEDTDIRWSNEGEGAFPFDRGTAHLLYRELLGPLASAMEGKRHLFVVSAGALSSLPFGVLVTEPPQGKDGDAAALRETAWLADDHAIVQLPSLQSLQLLRAVSEGGTNADANGSQREFLGFGDPILADYVASRDTSKDERRTRAGGDIRSAEWTRTASGAQRLASTDSLRALASLPGTRTELLAMQDIFGDRNSRLFLGEFATEERFRQTDLGNASVISLATHGLVAGELEGLAEPGLVFTPPAMPTDSNDGLLTSSEIATLELAADWVILSACNTASGDGTSGSDGLSGLARSFFFAGASSLLASHWPVNDEVAAIMTVRIFELQRDNPDWSRAEALHAAMQEIRDDPRKDGVGATWAHPSRWAPFAYIGDIRD